jgi:HK97 gp10 family phage protein
VTEIRIEGLKELVADLDKATSRALAEVRAIVEKGANNIKKDAVGRVSGLAHAPAYPRSIGYDIGYQIGAVAAQIGPDKNRRQGALGNILEYGTANNPPRPHLAPALRAEEPRYTSALEALAAKLLEKP